MTMWWDQLDGATRAILSAGAIILAAMTGLGFRIAVPNTRLVRVEAKVDTLGWTVDSIATTREERLARIEGYLRLLVTASCLNQGLSARDRQALGLDCSTRGTP